MLQVVDDRAALAGEAAGQREVHVVAAAAGGLAVAHARHVLFHVLLEHDVDHAAHRVGAVNRGRGTRQDFDALDDAGGDVVEVGEVALALVGHRIVGHAMAVDQQQAAARAEVAQVDRIRVDAGLAPVVIVLHRSQRGGDGLQRVVDGGEAFLAHLVGGNHGHRRRAFDLGALDARSGHGDGVEILGLAVRRTLIGLRLLRLSVLRDRSKGQLSANAMAAARTVRRFEYKRFITPSQEKRLV